MDNSVEFRNYSGYAVAIGVSVLIFMGMLALALTTRTLVAPIAVILVQFLVLSLMNDHLKNRAGVLLGLGLLTILTVLLLIVLSPDFIQVLPVVIVLFLATGRVLRETNSRTVMEYHGRVLTVTRISPFKSRTTRIKIEGDTVWYSPSDSWWKNNWDDILTIDDVDHYLIPKSQVGFSFAHKLLGLFQGLRVEIETLQGELYLPHPCGSIVLDNTYAHTADESVVQYAAVINESSTFNKLPPDPTTSDVRMEVVLVLGFILLTTIIAATNANFGIPPAVLIIFVYSWITVLYLLVFSTYRLLVIYGGSLRLELTEDTLYLVYSSIGGLRIPIHLAFQPRITEEEGVLYLLIRNEEEEQYYQHRLGRISRK